MSRSYKKTLFAKFSYYTGRRFEKRIKSKLCRRAKEVHHGSTYKKITKKIYKAYCGSPLKVTREQSIYDIVDCYIITSDNTPFECYQKFLNDYYRK